MGTRPLHDEVAYITGASAGIGAAVALELCRAGAAVVLGARRQDKLEGVMAQLEREVPGARVLALPLDVRAPASIDEWLFRGASLGPCSILVNNAGLAVGRHRVDEADEAAWDTMLDTNVRAVFSLTRKVLPGMRARGRGDIVMMASVAGLEPYAHGSVYCASKAALHAFSRSLRAEVLGEDIRVLTFDPGMVETEFSLVRNGGDAEAARKVYAGMRPLTAGDVAECVGFALTRPRHVSLDRMLILSTDQLGTQQVHRRA